MNEELVTINEVLNDGRTIHIYRQQDTDNWVSYGYSSYLLYNTNLINIKLANFSNRMQMPCVSISDAEFQNLINVSDKAVEINSGYCKLHSELKINVDSYLTWVSSMK